MSTSPTGKSASNGKITNKNVSFNGDSQITKRFSNKDNKSVEASAEKHPKSLKEEVKEKLKEFIGHFDHAPDFLKDNPFIHTGYRIHFNTPKKALKSLFMVHNESVNIWSHIIGAFVLIAVCGALLLEIYNYVNSPTAKNETLPKWPIIIFLLTGIFCMSCSASYHLFSCISSKSNKLFLRLDYAGIIILITGSCFPVFVYGFYCQPFYAKLYLTIIGVAGLAMFFITLGDKIYTPAYKTFKSLMFGGLALFAALPAVHLTVNYLNGESGIMNLSTSGYYYLGMAVGYGTGLTAYATKWPERFQPGKYDICGHSHQILHICDLVGLYFTYLGAFDNYYARLATPCGI